MTDKDYNPGKDTRTKHYLDKNVYTAAKERITDAINQSDSQAVLCSGGKDSIVTLHLLREVYHELGITHKINVIFMDEEVINQTVIDSIQQLQTMPDIQLYWFNIPITCDIYNHGNTREYIQNDPNRKHVREPPDDAITLEKLGIPSGTILTRYQLADIQANLLPGTVCLFKGIRTDESLFRLTQVLRRPQSPHIGKRTSKHFECIPIYDWHERDVFLYYYKNHLQYNKIYDMEMWSDTPLRVSTPMHSYNRKTYNKLRTLDPQLYQAIVEVWPDMAHADRYTHSKTITNHDFQEYPHTIHGLMQYIDDCYTTNKKQNLEVKKKILWAYKRRQQNKNKKGSDKFGGYPLYYLFNIIRRGATMRNIIPCEKPSQKMYTFEGYTPDDYLHDKTMRGQYHAANTTN